MHSHLTQRGWIELLGAGSQEFDHSTSLFSIELMLTEQGKDHVPEIMGLVFAQLDNLRGIEPEAWRYAEQAKIAALAFQFQEKGSTVGFVYQMAPRLNDYPPEGLTCGSLSYGSLRASHDPRSVGASDAGQRAD